MFDVLPELVRGQVGKWLKWLFTWAYDDGSIWSLSKYIDSSPEAAENIARALQKWSAELNIDDLKAYAKNFWAIEKAAKDVYATLDDAEKAAVGKMSKDLMWSMVNQTYWSNSTIWKRIRQMLANGSTNIADVVKYLWRIPWDVAIGPYVSTIKFKNWTQAIVAATWKEWQYDIALDTILPWWFDKRVREGFSVEDINRLNKESRYSEEWFDKVWDTYYLNQEGLTHYWLKAENASLESLWVSLKDAENTRELFKEKMKDLADKKISDTTVDMIADSGWYEEITLKVKEVLWC